MNWCWLLFGNKVKKELLFDFQDVPILIACDCESQFEQIIKQYIRVENIEKLQTLIFTTENPNFYEVINSKNRKLYLDFDLKITFSQNVADKILEHLCDVVLRTFKEMYPEDALERHDILIYQSHRDTKISLHIIIDKYAISDHREAKNFMLCVRESYSGSFLDYINQAPYIDRQLFCLEGCSKLKANNV